MSDAQPTDTKSTPDTAPTTLSTAARVVEFVRPIVLFALFVAASVTLPWWASAPLGLATVFAWSILVHDLIHNALRLPRVWGDLALAGGAMFLLKSGHALRALHRVHHRECLEDIDTEGNVVFMSFARLAVTGPWLALKARAESWKADPKTHGWQLVETALNALTVVALPLLAWRFKHPAPLVYWGCVVAVTISAPVWGAKIPHMIPYRHPLVRRVASWTGRLTPAVASVLLHELHHRRPGLPVALLPAHQHVLDDGAESDCARRMEVHDDGAQL